MSFEQRYGSSIVSEFRGMQATTDVIGNVDWFVLIR